MNRNTLLGIGFFLSGLIGYVVGIYVPYPGRAFSVTAVMIGIAFGAISRQSSIGEDA